MLLSKQQQFILDAVRRLGCVRRDQLASLADHNLGAMEPATRLRQTDAMLRQLRCQSDIRCEGDLVKLPGVVASTMRLEAIDVMLELAEGLILDFSTRQPPPILLRFSLDGAKLRLFAVAEMGEVLPTVERRKTERMILLPQGDTPPQGVVLPEKHFFAVRQQDGIHHRFYSGGEL